MKTVRTLSISGLSVLIGMAITFAAAVNVISGAGVTAEAMAEKRSFSTQSTGSMSSGDTMIELTPHIADKNRLVVKFRVNTHAVRLSRYDLKDITTLEYEGKVLKPVKTSSIGGHHSSGKFIFIIGEQIESFTIRIKGIPKVQERVYVWNVK